MFTIYQQLKHCLLVIGMFQMSLILANETCRTLLRQIMSSVKINNICNEVINT